MSVLSMFDLTGEKAIVTGGGQGLGRELALGLAEAGADVAVVQRNLELAQKAAEDIRKLGREAIALRVDVRQPADVENMVTQVKKEFGRIDILVNNAGVSGWIRAEELSFEEWNRVISTNLTGVFLNCKYVGQEMIAQRKGSIVNISSISGFLANHPQEQSHYNASKGGVNTFTKCLAYEWAKHNIRVNAIAPGFVGTPMLKEAGDKMLKEWASLNVQKRIGDPSELKGVVVFLASAAASYITGHVLIADGGYVIW
ncbi:MAG: SDR family oxidoreductase [Desulfobacterales bacterium]|nr:MAG: SDR family oxidoreductase [Desulfobacterales bacterium]